MVNYSVLASAAILALSATVAAAPTAPANSVEPFTFSQWIEDIIANPDGDHLTPEQAVAAKNAAVEAEEAQATAGILTTRAPRCQAHLKDAPAADAAACLDDLARKGAQGIQCGIGANQYTIQMCRIGRAEIVSSKSTSTYQQANCNDVARTGGLIFDSCWRADNTVKGSEICISNQMFQVNIAGL